MDFLNEDPKGFDVGSETHIEDDQRGTAYPRSVVVGVVLLSILILVLMFWQLKSRLTLDIPTFGDGIDLSDSSFSLLEAEDAQLKAMDSDEDGLSDYEELKLYGTSPFIADSDSDGLTDYTEIHDGTDPNCPQGQNCFIPGVAEDTTRVTFEESATVENELENILNSPDDIRRLLIQGGASPALVETLDNQTLQMLAQEAFSDISNNQDATEPAPEISNVAPDQLRKILLDNGMPQEDLDAISDEQLLEIFSQVSQESNTE